MARIASTKNAIVKRTAALLEPRTRRKEGLLLVEGAKAIEDALAAGARFEYALVRAGREGADGAAEALARAGVALHEVAGAVFDDLAPTETSQGLLAVAAEPRADAESVLDARGHAPLVVLDRIQDPGNLGTMLRTAAALGFRGAALTEGTTDPFAPKVVRATAATIFRFPVFPWPGEAWGFRVIAAAEGGGPPETAFAAASGASARPVALIVGNEGSGVAPALLEHAVGRVWIPIAPGVESLNVASAFAILAYALARASRASPPGGQA